MTMTFTLVNQMDAPADIFLAHAQDTSIPLPVTFPSPPDSVIRNQFPASTSYSSFNVPNGHGLTFSLDYEGGTGAAMDYWYVAVLVHGGRTPGAFSVSGTALLPTGGLKIPDSGQVSASLQQDPQFAAPLLSMGANYGGGRTQGGMSVMSADAAYNPLPTIRKDVANLLPEERAAYVTAVKALKQAPSRLTPPTSSRYDDYVLVHMLAMNQISVKDRTKPLTTANITIGDPRSPMWAHQGPAFLPWHRVFLRHFERDLQAVSNDPRLAIPYWNWGQLLWSPPAQAPWTDDFMGGDGHDGPVASGPFGGKAKWNLTISSDGGTELVRGFGLYHGDDGSTAKNMPRFLSVIQTLMEGSYDAAPWNGVTTLASFRNQLEGWYLPKPPQPGGARVGMHNLVHLWVGGNNGTMLPGSSPNDPVFFLHHSNIDRLWSFWQHTHTTEDFPHVPKTPFYAPTTPLPGWPGQSLNEPMVFMDPTVCTNAPWPDPPAEPADVVSNYALNYMFDDQLEAQPAGPVTPGTANPSPHARRL
jgi:tyrosinase